MVRHYRNSRSHYDRNVGYEQARRHIEAARRLSAELGGTDKDVKAYFFALPPHQLKSVLDDYGKQFGAAARQYAQDTIPKWKTGRVQMGGQTAERLFNLLPPRMPLQAKYQLTENLWKHFGPSSKKRLRIGLDANVVTVTVAVRSHIEQVVTHYRIPPDLERRFDWLSNRDAGVKQDLLNYVRNAEKAIVIEAARVQVPVMLQHLADDHNKYTQRIAQILKVGKHELEIFPDRNSSGVTLEDPPVFSFGVGKSGSGWGWIWPLLIFALVVLWLATKH